MSKGHFGKGEKGKRKGWYESEWFGIRVKKIFKHRHVQHRNKKNDTNWETLKNVGVEFPN